ncbi:unnamed protein product [Bursaphelenchus okinawaensis]|uniref:G-protein coupled receptors family 1 profile domain-containing protein n=1 Tax=Bursaphelenchus okinawaensis TaxID=465554 RepID=A0A811KUV8_9BILA|nr:unnamed protein product [Bursaphelenchus okinawaensis]CAG9111738.1 unnamed protein product [Bursaphelenchus okinawaensis]
MNETEEVFELQYLCPSCKVTAVVLYTTLSILAFIGNSLIVAVIVYFRRLHTATNMLIMNLAIADLMISIFCMPLSYWHVIIFEDQRWVFGAFLCKIFNFLQAGAVFLSSWTLVVISFDRFMAIMFVMSPWLRLTRRRAFLLILGTWAFSLVMALPLLIVNQTEPTPAGVETCQEKWELLSPLGDVDQIVHSYTSALFALQYCLPLFVLVITYTFIGLRMWNSKVPGADRTQSTRYVVQGRHDSVKKLIPMVLLVSALYAGCWLPQNLLMNIWVTYDPTITSHPYILYIWWAAHTIAMFHSIVNPFIYYWQNRRINEGVRYLLRWLPFIHFDNFHYLEEKPGSRAVKFVNMVAYMPVAGKKVLHSTVSDSG